MTVPDRARPVARASTAEVCFNMNVDIVLSPGSWPLVGSALKQNGPHRRGSAFLSDELIGPQLIEKRGPLHRERALMLCACLSGAATNQRRHKIAHNFCEW